MRRAAIVVLVLVAACSSGGEKAATTSASSSAPPTTLTRAEVYADLQAKSKATAGCLFKINDKVCTADDVAAYADVDAALARISDPASGESIGKWRATYADFTAKGCVAGSSDSGCDALNRDLQTRLLVILEGLKN